MTSALKFHDLGAMISRWEPDASLDRCRDAATNINNEYNSMRFSSSHHALSMARLERSLWAKRATQSIFARLRRIDPSSIVGVLDCLQRIRGTLEAENVQSLCQWQQSCGNRKSAEHVLECLVNTSDVGSEPTYSCILTLMNDFGLCQKIGPPAETRFRPIRKTGRHTPHAWLQDPKFGSYEFLDENPDHVRYRGLELRSGDIGIVELNSPGDGILESFLDEPGLAPHAMLFVTRRITSSSGEVIYQPSLLEIFEEGWRTIPLSTGLSQRFSWYSEWIRPAGLASNVGEGLSKALDQLGSVAFDFQARRAPSSGDFSTWEQPCATCTNLIRIPFEMLGMSLPYVTTSVHNGARQNLARIGLGELEAVHTPTDILMDSTFESVGIVDNGQPEWSIGQAMVLGRPQQLHSFGGYFSQRDLQIENLPDWKSVTRWRSAWESAKIAIGQSSGLIASLACQLANFDHDAIPRSASPTAIAFYLRSAMESGYIVSELVPALRSKLDASSSVSVEDLRVDEELQNIVRGALARSSLEREGWYAPL